MIEIVDILGRAESGVSTRPFRCLGEDDQLYYVKLGNARPDGLIGEWVGGHLANLMGLPVADFSLVHVDEEFSKHLNDDYHELGSGIGFGSAAAKVGYRDLLYLDISRLEPDLLAEVLIFDLWIQNEDRKLGLAGGNPNALFVPHREGTPLLLIDHDSAFDETFNTGAFLNDHFARDAAALWRDKARKRAWTAKAKKALSKLPEIWATLPDSWAHNTLGERHDALDMNEIEATLEQPMKYPNTFWKGVGL